MDTDIPWDPLRMEFKPVEMTLVHEEKMRFTATSPSGVVIPIDAHTHLGGGGAIPNPIEYLIASLGGCVGIKILLSLSDEKIVPERLHISIRATRRQTLPATFDHVHFVVSLTGMMDEQLIAGILSRTMDHLCPIAAMFAEVGEVTWESRISSS